MLPLLLLSTSLAAEPTSVDLTWTLSLGDQAIGERTATIKTRPAERGTRRVLEVLTDIDATVLGMGVAYEQRLTAHAGTGPASFHSVVSENRRRREIQGRSNFAGWTVSVVDASDARTWEVPTTKIDLSTADLLDPGSLVTLDRYEEVRLLSSETGDIFTVSVEPLGASTVSVGGEEVGVTGYALHGGPGTTRVYYASSGYLVKHETRLLGRSITAVLTEPPPVSVDDAPLIESEAVTETDL